MRRNLDLSAINSKSMAALLNANMTTIYEFTSTSNLLNFISELFKSNGVDTVASNRLLNNIRKSKSLTEAQFIVTNSLLKGCGLGVI